MFYAFFFFFFGFPIGREQGIHTTILSTLPQGPNTYSKDRFSPRQTSEVGQRGDISLGWGRDLEGGSIGNAWEPNTGWALTGDPKVQGLKMNTLVSSLEKKLCLVCRRKWSKDQLLWFRYGCVVFSHPGKGIAY